MRNTGSNHAELLLCFDDVVQIPAANRADGAGVLLQPQNHVALPLHLAFHPFDNSSIGTTVTAPFSSEVQFGFVLADDSADGSDAVLQLLDAIRLLLGGGDFGLSLFQTTRTAWTAASRSSASC